MNNLYRLIGQETEYAIRFTADDPTAERPSNSLIYQTLKEGIEEYVSCHESDRNMFQEQFFVQNGGSFNYEFLPFAPSDGLIEGGTPECSNPYELLIYQKAQEELLLKAIPLAEDYLESLGYSGSIGLIKNCRDAEGNIYGAQENYELPLAKGLNFFLYKIGIISYSIFMAFISFILAMIVLTLILTLIISIPIFLILFAVFQIIAYYIPFLGRKFLRLKDQFKAKRDRFEELMADEEQLTQAAGQWEYKYLFPIESAFLMPVIFWQKLFVFKEYRNNLNAFFITRIIISGAGSLMEDQSFVLSEKASAMKRLFRTTVEPYQRPIFDNGNLIKEVMLAGLNILVLRFTRFKQLFREKQRFQLGMSDSNRCQLAEYLKLSITSLMMDMVEEGYLEDAPKLKKPLEALRTINTDPALKAKVQVKKCQEMTALEIQRFYLEKAKEFIQNKKTVSIEAQEIVGLWEEILNQLEKDPSKLIGRIDWVTKRYLIESSGKDESFSVQKKIDIAYHELGSGYYNKLEESGIALKIVKDEDVENAVYEPSSPDRVQIRSKYITDALFEGDVVKISWNSIQIGNKKNRKIIDLNEFKKNKS